MEDVQRSMPSMFDGLNTGQRKILFCAFKRNLVNEVQVAQFSGYVSEHSAYHYGEQNLAKTIIGMAQDFVGSNNINLLQPIGHFGTRHHGGKDHASARHIYTCLSPMTRLLFPKDDDILLDYLNEDGQSIKPSWYMPIIPMVLVNGGELTGTDWSTYIPKYNPRDIVANVRRLLNNEKMQPMDPWYRGFKGLIKKSPMKETGVTYTITGVIDKVDETTLRITELPIRRWVQDYKEFLESLMTGKDKKPFIEDYRVRHDDTSVHFEVILSKENMNLACQEGLEKTFELSTTISTNKMLLFNPEFHIKKYDTPEEILEEFFHLKLEFYEKRKKDLLNNLELDLLKLGNKMRFIEGVLCDLIVFSRNKSSLIVQLRDSGFTPFPKQDNKGSDVAVGEATKEVEENEEATQAVEGVVGVYDYDYLLSMSAGSLNRQTFEQLLVDKESKQSEVEKLRKSLPKSLWMKDLDALERELEKQDREDGERER